MFRLLTGPRDEGASGVLLTDDTATGAVAGDEERAEDTEEEATGGTEE